MVFSPSARASCLVEICRSPCMRQISGCLPPVSSTIVLITVCSSTPSASALVRVPPFSTYLYRCGWNATFAALSARRAGVDGRFSLAT